MARRVWEVHVPADQVEEREACCGYSDSDQNAGRMVLSSRGRWVAGAVDVLDRSRAYRRAPGWTSCSQRDQNPNPDLTTIDWPFNKPAFPGNGREPTTHEIRTRGHVGRVVNDDVLAFNTQSSSQWDALRHNGNFTLTRTTKKIQADGTR
ncbi:MAG: hypothetical protein Q9217_004263, partial [Psora testacea]